MTISFSYLQKHQAAATRAGYRKRGVDTRVFERFAARDRPIAAGDDVGAALQARHVAAQQIQQHGLGNVVGVVAGADGVHLKQHGTAVERLAPEDAAERAVVLVADFAHYCVHAPAVELLVRQHSQLQLVLPRIALHSFKRIIPVSSDAFVDAQKAQAQPVASLRVQLGHDVREHGGVFAARSCDADALARTKQIAAHDGKMHFLRAVRRQRSQRVKATRPPHLLEQREEAFPAHPRTILRALHNGARRLAALALHASSGKRRAGAGARSSA